MQVGQEVGVLDDGLCFVGTIIDVLVDTSNNPYYQAQFEVQEGHENDDRVRRYTSFVGNPLQFNEHIAMYSTSTGAT